MPPKKKLSKKDKARLEAEQAELLRIEMRKEKLKKLKEARQRRKLEGEQAKRRLQLETQENKIRRSQLKVSMAFFDQIQGNSDAIIMAIREQNDWEKFMRCNGLPNSNSPSDLRKYIHQWQTDIEHRNRECCNWLLKTNERTLLTQDISIPDKCKATLRKQQGNLGDVYAQRIKEILGILSELEEALADKRKAQHILLDLKKLKKEIRVLLKDYLDDFTRKIMSHIERDMEIDRPGVSRHIYESKMFKSHIWTFSKDAQISLNARPEENLHNEIDFPLIEMQISLPPFINLHSSALRGLWLNYDHFSDYCPSFNLKVRRPDNINILKQSNKEWRKRKEILQNMLDEFSKEIPLTDLEQFDHEWDLISQQIQKDSLDVDKLYLKYEDELSKLRREAFGPAGFNLLATDVNLRKYRIIGGVYCADYLETPQQDKQLNTRLFIKTTLGPNKLSHKNYYQTFTPPPAPQPGVRRLPEEIEAEMRMVEAALDKLALITVQLPANVIWFEPPIACRWETQIETLESDLAEINNNFIEKTGSNAADSSTLPSITHFSPLKNPSSRFPASELHCKSSRNIPVKEINDFDMLHIPNNIDICSLTNDFIVPRLPFGFSVQINDQRLKQLQQTKQRANKKWNKPKKLLFLARPQASLPNQSGKATSDEIEKKISGTRLTEDFVDFDEPREIFPSIQFEKVLKINRFNENQEFKLDLRKQSNAEQNENLANSTSLSPTTSKCTMISCKSFKDEDTSEEYIANQDNQTYMFSELIQDLDHLRDLQTPKMHEGLLKQVSVSLKANNSSQRPEAQSMTGDGKGEGQTPFGPYSGISFLRDVETSKNGCNGGKTNMQNRNDEKDNDDSTSTDESEHDDDYDEFFFNQNLTNDNEEVLKSNRSEVSGGTTAASTGKEADVHNFLNKHNVYDSNSTAGNGTGSKMLNETIFTQGKWSTRDVYDAKFNEDKLSIQFRTGRLGIFGFALNRYSNMPYQTWDIKPDTKKPGNILFSFTASLISLDISITPQGYCVNNFQGGSTATIDEMIGKTLSLDAIKQILISSAVDIFPDEDAFCYTEGSCEKNYVMEMHLYACMSTLSLSHKFSWSRWNLLAGSRTAVLLSRELVDGKKMPNHSTLLVTPLKTSIIDCTEFSTSFNSQSIESMDYYADLYQLAQVHAHPSSLEKQRNIDPMLRNHVATILKAIRPLSFC